MIINFNLFSKFNTLNVMSNVLNLLARLKIRGCGGTHDTVTEGLTAYSQSNVNPFPTNTQVVARCTTLFLIFLFHKNQKQTC